MDQIAEKFASIPVSKDEKHRQKLLTLASTGRHVMISYPEDMTDQELLDFLGWQTHQFRQELPAPSGVVPVRGVLPGGH